MLKLALESQDHVVVEARDQEEAVAALRDSQPALVLSDLRLPKGDGLGVLRAVKEVDSELPVIVMTAHGSIQDAVERSEEHTSELQSRLHLVCRLLLEKKKKRTNEYKL